MKTERYICQLWNDEPPKDCSGCSCSEIHDEVTKDYFIRNEMCDLYEPIEVNGELENEINKHK